jgi:hypothetical protein
VVFLWFRKFLLLLIKFKWMIFVQHVMPRAFTTSAPPTHYNFPDIKEKTDYSELDVKICPPNRELERWFRLPRDLSGAHHKIVGKPGSDRLRVLLYYHK